MTEVQLQTTEEAFAVVPQHASAGLFWELNPGLLAPEARIISLDQTAN